MRFPALQFTLAFLLSAGVGLAGRAQTAPADGTKRVALTDAERAWVTAHPVVKVGHDPSYSPYAIEDAAGRIVGIDPDFLELIASRTGLQFQDQVRPDWGQMIEDFKAGGVDLLMSLGHTPEREQYLIYTHSYTLASNVIITRSDEPNLSALSDLKGRTIGFPRGYPGLRRDLNESAPGTVITEYDTPAECYQAVARGEVDASIGDVANASYLIKLHQLTNLRFGSVLSTSSALFIGVRKDWPVLVSIINKALADISAEDRQRVNSRWIVADAASNRWWARAFKIAAGTAAVAVAVFLLMLFRNRILARELVERRRIQRELEQTRDRLVQSSKERSELMHMVAHDLRGPLSAIQLGMELLRLDPPLNESGRNITTRRITESAGQMAKLINDLLSAQNVDEGRYSLNFTAGDVSQLIRSSVAALDTAAQHKRIAVAARVPETLVPLTTDYVALQQVADNLLSNAIKYSPLDSAVEITVVASPAHCRIEVRDQGPGVKLEEREKIFEKYSRGSAQPTHGEESIGLGLWIVRRFVTALHGRVWCEPSPGVTGSIFIVELPLRPPAA